MRQARSVVAGRFVNAFSRRDWILGLVHRGSNGEPLASLTATHHACTATTQAEVTPSAAAFMFGQSRSLQLSSDLIPDYG